MGDVARNLGPGEGQDVAIGGRTIYVKETTGQLRVVFDGSESYAMRQGDKITRERFTHFRLEDASGQGADCTLVVTSGDFDQRIVGAVSIRDSVPLRVNIAKQSLSDRPYLRANQTFAERVGKPPTQEYGFYIHNPLASGVNIIDPRMTAVAPTEEMRFSVFRFYASDRFGNSRAGSNKNLHSVDSSAGLIGNSLHIRDIGQVTISAEFFLMCERGCKAVFDAAHGGHLIPPGTGLFFEDTSEYHDGAGTAYASFEWIEQRI